MNGAVEPPVVEIVREQHRSTIDRRDAQAIELRRRRVEDGDADLPAHELRERVARVVPLPVDPNFDTTPAGHEPRVVPSVRARRELGIASGRVVRLTLDHLLHSEVSLARAQNKPVEVEVVSIAEHETVVRYAAGPPEVRLDDEVVEGAVLNQQRAVPRPRRMGLEEEHVIAG